MNTTTRPKRFSLKRELRKTLTAVQKRHPLVPKVGLAFSDVPENADAMYDELTGCIFISDTCLKEYDNGLPYWQVILLHEYRHHLQYADRVIDRKTWYRYTVWRKDFVRIELDADHWAFHYWRDNYHTGKRADLRDAREAIRTETDLKKMFKRRKY